MIYINSDGTIRFEAGDKIGYFKNYQPHPTDPWKLIPKFDVPCPHRFFHWKTPCGRGVALWKCSLFKKTIGIKECGECDEPRKAGTIALRIVGDGSGNDSPDGLSKNDSADLLGTESSLN